MFFIEQSAICSRLRLVGYLEPASSRVARFSFAGRLWCAEAAEEGVVTDPAGDCQHGKGTELSRKIADQKMELLEACPLKRKFAGQGDRGERDS